MRDAHNRRLALVRGGRSGSSSRSMTATVRAAPRSGLRIPPLVWWVVVLVALQAVLFATT
jgi:hypothetical protein